MKVRPLGAFRPAGSNMVDPILVILWLALIAIAIVWILPFLIIVITSIKTNALVMGTHPFAIPKTFDWKNYVSAWSRGNFSVTMKNSVIITAIKVPLGVFISAMAAYALNRIKFPFRRALFLLIVFGTMIPFQVMLPPIFEVVNKFGLINRYTGVIMPYLAFGVPYQVFILYSFFNEIPKEISEAAMIDGASHIVVFWRIFLPAAMPAIAALFILDFVATWNEFAMALVILQKSNMWTLPLGLMSFQNQHSSNYGELSAAVVMTVLPAVLIYMMFQRYFVSGLTVGAVKE